MRRILRPGTVLLVAGAGVLGLAAQHRVTSPDSPRVLSDRAAFSRYAAGRPGRFRAIHVKAHGVDVVCAVHSRPRYRLCGTVRRRADGVRVFTPRPSGRTA
jgi:hypothetical protein